MTDMVGSSLSDSLYGGSSLGGLRVDSGAGDPADRRDNQPTRAIPTTDLEDFRSEVSNFAELIKKGREHHKALGAEGSPELSELLGTCKSLAHGVTSLLDAVNGLPNPSGSRDVEIGRTILPMAILSWSKVAPSGDAKLLHELYARAHTKEGSDRVVLDVAEPLRGVLPYLSVTQTGKKFPGHRAYVESSESIAPKLSELDQQAAELQVKLTKVKEKNDAAQAASGKSPFQDVIASVEQQISEIQDKVPPLLDEVTDVRPRDVDQAMNALHVKVSGSARIISELNRCASSIERVLLYSVIAASGSKLQETELRVPLLTGRGAIEVHQVALESDDLAKIGSSTEQLAELVDTLHVLRSSLCKLLPTLPFAEGLAQGGDVKLRESLRQIFAKYGESGQAALERMQKLNSPELDRSLARLFQDQIVIDPSNNKWSHILEDPNNLSSISWAVKKLITTQDEEDAGIFRDTLDASRAVSESMLGICERARSLYRKEDFGALALFLNEQLSEQVKHPELLRAVGVMSLLSHFAFDKEAAQRLRFQIPKLEEIKDLAGYLGREIEPMAPIVSRTSHEVLKRLSASMVDFLKGEQAQELWEFIEVFKFYMENPGILEGVPGNEGMRSGILLVGKPGVGKTYLAECLQNELSIKMFSISPEAKQEDQEESMIRVAQKILKKARELSERGEFCMVFIDEAEAILADRDNPRTTAEQAELTDYLLQEINEIRRKHPRILIVAATNFLDRIDPAMMRDGRLDYAIFMGLPEKETRKAILLDTISKENIPLNLNPEQLDELAELTEGFMPLPIKRTLTQLNRVMGPFWRSQGEEFEWSFEVVRDQYAHERDRQERDKAKSSEEVGGSDAPSANA